MWSKNLCLFSIITLFIFSCKKEDEPKQAFEYKGTLGDVIRIIETETFSPTQVLAQLPSSISALVTPKYTVKVFFVEYKSENKDKDTVKASGIIIIPMMDSFAIPLISYQHGTVLPKTSAPFIVKGEEYKLNLAIASMSGTLACVPDYLGLGTGDGLHMYLNPREEANSVRDILRCARKLVRDSGFTALNGQVLLYGYSQGGHATMAAQRQMELENENEFTLTASAPMAGPYAMSRTSQFNVMLDSLYYPNPFYLPYLAVSLFNTFHVYSSYSELFKEPYATSIPSIIDGYHSYSYANSQFDYYVSNMFLDSVKQAIRINPNHPIRIACKLYDLVDDWTPKTPTRLYHCHGDDNVFYDNAVYADSVFRAKGAPVELIDLGADNHTDCAPSAIFLAGTWLQGFIQHKKIK